MEKRTRTTKAPAKKRTTKKASPKRKTRDSHIPAVGTELKRRFKDEDIKVQVTEDGFEYQGQTFKSISAVARHITGYMISGPVFFKLDKDQQK